MEEEAPKTLYIGVFPCTKDFPERIRLAYLKDKKLSEDPYFDLNLRSKFDHFNISNDVEFRKLLNYEKDGFEGMVIEINNKKFFTPDRIKFYSFNQKTGETSEVNILEYYPSKIL